MVAHREEDRLEPLAVHRGSLAQAPRCTAMRLREQRARALQSLVKDWPLARCCRAAATAAPADLALLTSHCCSRSRCCCCRRQVACSSPTGLTCPWRRA